MYDIIIIGGGPAGLTAATYACRAGKTVLVIEKAAFGGQITWSPKVENFPTIISISGTELGDRLLEQAMEQGILRRISLPILQRMISASIEDFLANRTLEQQGISYIQALEEMISIIWEGIAVR